jgi:hypothetical protein
MVSGRMMGGVAGFVYMKQLVRNAKGIVELCTCEYKKQFMDNPQTLHGGSIGIPRPCLQERAASPSRNVSRERNLSGRRACGGKSPDRSTSPFKVDLSGTREKLTCQDPGKVDLSGSGKS